MPYNVIKCVLKQLNHVSVNRASWARVTPHALMETCELHRSAVILVHVYTKHCGPPVRFLAHAHIWRGVRQKYSS